MKYNCEYVTYSWIQIGNIAVYVAELVRLVREGE